MSTTLKEPNPVRYFTAVMYNPEIIPDPHIIITELFGEAVLSADLFEFDHTKYYEPEMGEKLKKYFVAFGGLQDPALLPMYKRRAIDTEEKYRQLGNRAINIDPGYVAIEKVVVATTKNFTHRVYIADGIFGDVQLVRKKGVYTGLEWTYADYIREESLSFFLALSKLK